MSDPEDLHDSGFRHMAWSHRVGVSFVALAAAGVLVASWLLIGLAGRPVAYGGEGIALALFLTLIVLALVATASVIVWRASAARAAALLAWFMTALAWGAAWHFFKLDAIQDRFLEAWVVKWAADFAPEWSLQEFLRAAARRMAWFDESAHVALMVAPTLFLLFSEQFPTPLDGHQLAQSPLRRLIQPRLPGSRLRSSIDWRWRDIGAVEVQIIFSSACIGLAIVLGASVSFDARPVIVALMFMTSGMAIAAVTAWAVRKFEGESRPRAIERWLTAGLDQGRPSLPLSSVLLLLFLAVSFEIIRDRFPGLPRAARDDALGTALGYGVLLAPVLLMRIRAVRAISKPVFWAGWVALLVGASPGLPSAFSLTTDPLGRDVAAMALWTLVCSLAATVNFAVRYASADSAERRRIDWVLIGIFLSCAAMVVIIAYALVCSVPGLRCGAPSWLARWGLLAPAGFLVISMLVAVFYRGAIDSRLALQRSVTYVLVGLVVTLVFAGIEILLDHMLSAVSGPDISKWVAASITFVVINPTKHACEKVAVRGTDVLLRLISVH